MHLTVTQFVMLATAFAVAALRLLTASKPFWSATPLAKYLTIWGPACLAAFAALPAALTGATSWIDVAVALMGVAAVAGTAAHGDKTAKAPSVPTLGTFALTMLVFVSVLPLTACGIFAAEWPKLAEHCAPSKADLLQDVEAVLSNLGDVEAQLKQIALREGKDAVECAVQQVVDELSHRFGVAREERALERGRAFLAKVPK